MIRKEGQALSLKLLEDYPVKREIIKGRLLGAESILRTSLYNVGFQGMWDLLSEQERQELKAVVLREE